MNDGDHDALETIQAAEGDRIYTTITSNWDFRVQHKGLRGQVRVRTIFSRVAGMTAVGHAVLAS
jgi:hypothetical protein